jgi:arginyl-tRNA--protein-N-Asp/Glu arginylyltransferase
MNYFHWNSQTITDFSEDNISDMYDRGYVFTRIGRGVMHQTRSVRIDLSKFELTSENRRILKKMSTITMNDIALPLADYDFKIGKLAKDFYETKFGPNIMSAVKIKEMLTDTAKSNFNILLAYRLSSDSIPRPQGRTVFSDASEAAGGKDLLSPRGCELGYSICYSNNEMLHYSYPFYDLNVSPKDMGLGMMIIALEYANKTGMKYAYLGSLQRPTDTYKLQFKGLEWFDGKAWSTDENMVREILATEKDPS